MDKTLADYIRSIDIESPKLTNALPPHIQTQVNLWFKMFGRPDLTEGELSVARLLSDSVMISIARILRDEKHDPHEGDTVKL